MNRSTDSVRICLFDAHDSTRFLVLAEADDPDNWKLPGGKFDSVDEMPEAAARRELAEELRLDATTIAMELVGELTNYDGVSKRYIFTATVNNALPVASEEVSGIQWVLEDSLPESPNAGHIQSAIAATREYLSKR
jgi:8-oxo-dGTP pyrophosphatase MutT (NUDIX family)